MFEAESMGRNVEPFGACKIITDFFIQAKGISFRFCQTGLLLLYVRLVSQNRRFMILSQSDRMESARGTSLTVDKFSVVMLNDF